MSTIHKTHPIPQLAAWLLLAATLVGDPVSTASAYQRGGYVYQWKTPYAPNALVNSAPLETRGGVVDIAIGGYFGLALKANGNVVAWGTQMGFLNYDLFWTTDPTFSRPTAEMLTGVKGFCTQSEVALVIKTNGAVLGWGDTFSSALRIPAAAQSGVALIRCIGSHVVAIKDDGSVLTWGTPLAGVTAAALSNLSARHPVAVACGYGFDAFVLADGTIQILGADGAYAATQLAGIHDAVAIELGLSWANVLRGGGPGCTRRLERVGIDPGDGPYSFAYPDGCSVRSSFYNEDEQFTLACRTDGSLVGWNWYGGVAGPADGSVAGTYPPGLANVVAVGGQTFFADALVLPNPGAPRLSLLATVTDLGNLLATLNDPNGRTADAKHLREAIADVTQASTANLWLPGDNLHVSLKHGDKVFDEIKKAISELVAAKSDRNSLLADAALDDQIASLLASASEIAQAAINDAAQANGDAKKLAAARAAFAEGDVEAYETQRNSQTEAIADFREAWKKAQDAMK